LECGVCGQQAWRYWVDEECGEGSWGSRGEGELCLSVSVLQLAVGLVGVLTWNSGMIETPMNAAARKVAAESGDKSLQANGRFSGAMEVALRRNGKAREVANLIAFLLGDESCFITGASYSVDGGWNC
jgi:NAD(P)-dependent dehydrogenase (short-subunit alcohol dehydrogenase family)